MSLPQPWCYGQTELEGNWNNTNEDQCHVHKQYGKSGKVEKAIKVNTGGVLSVALGCEKTGP